MKITRMGSDYVRITEANMADPSLMCIPRIHIIKLDFKEPTADKVDYILKTHHTTNRFAIDRHIKFYNDILRKTSKKYYVANTETDSLISFFKRNNKVLLDTTKLNPLERAFVFSICLNDILMNVEVMIVSEKNYNDNSVIFGKWTGNLILV